MCKSGQFIEKLTSRWKQLTLTTISKDSEGETFSTVHAKASSVPFETRVELSCNLMSSSPTCSTYPTYTPTTSSNNPLQAVE